MNTIKEINRGNGYTHCQRFTYLFLLSSPKSRSQPSLHLLLFPYSSGPVGNKKMMNPDVLLFPRQLAGTCTDSSKQWYVCTTGNFRGCCSSDPCTAGVCPDDASNAGDEGSMTTSMRATIASPTTTSSSSSGLSASISQKSHQLTT